MSVPDLLVQVVAAYLEPLAVPSDVSKGTDQHLIIFVPGLSLFPGSDHLLLARVASDQNVRPIANYFGDDDGLIVRLEDVLRPAMRSYLASTSFWV